MNVITQYAICKLFTYFPSELFLVSLIFGSSYTFDKLYVFIRSVESVEYMDSAEPVESMPSAIYSTCPSLL